MDIAGDAKLSGGKIYDKETHSTIYSSLFFIYLNHRF